MSDLAPDPKLRRSPNRKLIKPIRTSRLEPKFRPKNRKTKRGDCRSLPTDPKQASGKPVLCDQNLGRERGRIDRTSEPDSRTIVARHPSARSFRSQQGPGTTATVTDRPTGGGNRLRCGPSTPFRVQDVRAGVRNAYEGMPDDRTYGVQRGRTSGGGSRITSRIG